MGLPRTLIRGRPPTTTPPDRWVEEQIAAGRLSPGARGMSAEDAAEQHNQANGLDTSDAYYLYTPNTAQATARDVLSLVGIDVPENHWVTLTDTDQTGIRFVEYHINPSQLEGGIEQYRLTTGEAIEEDH